MLFTLEVLPAAEGDCLLLHWGTADDPRLAVIDGGPGRTYEDHLRARLLEIMDRRGISQLPLDLVLVSHVDSDHTTGIKKLVRALRKELEDKIAPGDRPLRLKRLWHNAFNDILGDPTDEYYRTLGPALQAGFDGQLSPQLIDVIASNLERRYGVRSAEAHETAQDVSLILAGHGDGREVRDDHRYLADQQQAMPLNTPFHDEQGHPVLITARDEANSASIAGAEFTIVGPSQSEIEALQKDFDAYLKKHGLAAEAVLAAYADTSITNLSSIVCLVKVGSKTLLLTGDARGDRILAGLESSGLLGKGEKLEIDILKVPHHGSARNVEPDFFQRVLASSYVFSGDGKHGNPDLDTFEWIIDARGREQRYEIVTTYSLAHIDGNRKREVEKKGREWRDERDSLEVFFGRIQNDGYQLSLRAGAPLKLELGDEILPW